jgi:cyclase
MEVARQIYAETCYEGINAGAIITPAGVICIDVPTYAKDARDWAARMHRLSPYPVQALILTDCSGDRILNTRWLNAPLIMQQNAADQLRVYDRKYPPALLEQLVQRNPHRARELTGNPVESISTSFSGEIVMLKHGREIVLRHAGGPTSGNMWVVLPDRKIMFCGDTLMVGYTPHLAAPVATAWIAALDELLTMLPDYRMIPGRGSNPAPEDITAARDWLLRMQARVQEQIAAGVPREEIAALAPEFSQNFPHDPYPPEWTLQQIANSLIYCYDELQSLGSQ